MCGINGLIKKNSNSNNSFSTLQRMNEKIIHRGPDDDGFFKEKIGEYSIEMAMRRLSVIDLSSGKQPIFSNDGKKVILFNGEIYNYKILKADLIDKGYKFETQSDTEVIVNLYDCFGISAFSMLDGMFAFSLYDRTLGKVFIVRDFFGEKPLYYYKNEDAIFWASELKSIISVLPITPNISLQGLNLYFQLTYIPAPYTIYKGVFKLEANHFLSIDCSDLSFEINEIKQTFIDYNSITKKEAINTTESLVRRSVTSRSIADVPLGTFLSGGVDSSIISLCLAQNTSKKINTFSVGFKKREFNETDKSQIVAKLINSNHHEFIIDEADLTKNLELILANFDEPFADSSALASHYVSEKTKNHVTVALTGDGGDEVFGGYNKYYIGKLNNRYTKIIPEKLHKWISSSTSNLLKSKDDSRGLKFKIKKLIDAINYDGDFYYNIISLGFHISELDDLLNNSFRFREAFDYYKDTIGENNKTISDYRNIDRVLSLEGDMLVKVDRTSMLTSLECRAPFLNKEIWNFTNQLPENFLINGWDKKHILKEAFKDYFPNDFLNKSKQGFGVPVGDWLRGALKNELISFIDKDFLIKQNIFNPPYISEIVIQHLNSKMDNTFKIWTFYCFQKWYKVHYE